MSSPTISIDDAARIKRLVNDCAHKAMDEGFEALHIGTVMAAVGAAMVEASGSTEDTDKVVRGLADAVRQHRGRSLQ